MKLEKLYSFVRFLLTKLPKETGGPIYSFDEEIALKYYRLEKTYEGSPQLEKDKVADLDGPTEVGTSSGQKEQIHLSKLIDILNERFGTEFKPADQLFFESIREGALSDSKIRKAAEVNTMENFGFVFRKALDDLFIDRMDANENITAKFMDDNAFRKIVTEHLTREVFEEITGKKKKRYELRADWE